MRIMIVGAGALGGLVGALLTESGEEVDLLEINTARARLLNETGLFFSEADKGERSVQINVVCSIEDVRPVDLVFVAVKSYETENATRSVLPMIGKQTLVLSMQNGIGNAEAMARIIPPEQVLCGITYHSIQHTGPNRLRYRTGIKPIQIAPFQGKLTPAIEAIGDVFRKANLATNVVENIDHVVWQKLLHNAVVNPVSALTGLTCRELLDDAYLQAFMRGVCMEIIAVMRARGVPIVDEEDPYRPVIGSQRALGKNRPSMWQDLARGQRTEIDAINGAIVDEGKRLGIDTPLNWGLVQFIHSREQQKILRKEEIAATIEAASRQPETKGKRRPTQRETEGGMPTGRVPLETAPRLKELIRSYYLGLQAAANDPARPIAWVTGMGPVELIRALGYTPYFPENHAALIGASRQTGKYIPRAMAEGFSQFASSAMTSDIGAMIAGDSPLVTVYGIDGPPTPDVVVYNTNNGHGLIRWFEYYGRHFDRPVLSLHPPTALGEIHKSEIDTVIRQMQRMNGRLEKISGRRLDMDRLAEVVRLSAEASDLWRQILELCRNVPSPMTVFDQLVHVAPMVLLRGTQEAVEYYRILKAELESRIAENQAAVPGERLRVYWEGPPIWCALRPLANLFMSQQVAIVASTYTGIFALNGLEMANPIESLARAYTAIFPNRSDEYKSDYLISQFKNFAVDGVIYHEGRTAPEHSNVRYGLEVRLRRLTGLPSLVIEADTHDLRLFSMEQVKRELGEFLEATGQHEPIVEGV